MVIYEKTRTGPWAVAKVQWGVTRSRPGHESRTPELWNTVLSVLFSRWNNSESGNIHSNIETISICHVQTVKWNCQWSLGLVRTLFFAVVTVSRSEYPPCNSGRVPELSVTSIKYTYLFQKVTSFYNTRVCGRWLMAITNYYITK